MDTLSHALYGKGFFGYRKYRWFSFLFGALPDLLSFGLYFLYILLSNIVKLNFGKPSDDTIPYWVYDLYDFSHSIVIAFILCSDMIAHTQEILESIFANYLYCFGFTIKATTGMGNL